MLVLSLFSVCSGTVRAQLSPQQWRQDLQALANLPKVDPFFLTQTTPEAFAKAVAQLDADIPNLSDSQIVVAMAQLAALGNDGHTNLWLTQATSIFHMYPLQLYWFKEGVYAIAGSGNVTGVLGKRLTKIGDTPIAEALARVTTAISHDTEQWARFVAPTYLMLPELLAAVGITADVRNPARFTFDNGDGTEVTVSLLPVSLGSPLSLRVPHRAAPANPLYQRNPDFLYWTQYLEASQTLYIKYNSCAQDPLLPFTDFTAEVLKIIGSQPVVRIVFDLRNNEGGLTTVLAPLLDRVAEGVFTPISVAVIIGRETFSSAVLNAYDLWKAGATLVGEAAGWNPNGFGQTSRFTLPNSRLTVFYSTRKFTLPGVFGSLLLPDVAREVTWADYSAERDVFLDAAISLPAAPAGVTRIRKH